MSLLPFIVMTLGACVGALATRRWAPVSLAIGLTGLGLATLAALAIVPGDHEVIGVGQVQATEFGRLFLTLGAFTGLLVAVVALATEWRPELPAAMLGGFGTLGVALAIGDPTIALLAILVASLGVTLLTVAAPVTARDVTIASREFRAIVVAGALAIVGMAWIARPVGTPPPDPTVYGLAFLAVAIGTAIRFGAIPFHRWAARLADSAPEPALPLLLAWAPAAFAVVALAWMDRSMAPLLLPLDTERGLVAAVAALTIILGAVGAWLQDDLEHVVGYSILQDAGFIILGLAILDPAAWQPTRAWILIFVVVKTAFAAWAIALRVRFGSRRIPELGGWARRAPLLAVSLLLIVIATIGVPGLLSWDVRSELIDLSLGSGPMGIVVLLGGVASLAYYGRIALAGVSAPSTLVVAGAAERPRRAPAGPTDPTAGAATGGEPTLNDAEASAAATRATPRGGGRRAATPPVGHRLVATWRANRAPIASAGVLVLALIGLTVGVGGLGSRAAAAAPAPDPGAPTETYVPVPSTESPSPSEGEPSAAPSADASASSEPGSESASPDQASPTPTGSSSPAASGSPTASQPVTRARRPRRRPPGPPGRRPARRRPPETRRSVGRGERPAVDLAVVVEQLARGEPEGQLAHGGLGTVRRVDEVLGGLEGEVAPDRARRGLVRSGGPDHRADDRDRVRALDGEGHERARRDEVDQRAEERSLAVDRVVLLGQVAAHLDELEPDELEPALLEAADDPADEQALDAVGLDEDEGAFGHGGWSYRLGGACG